MIDRELYEAEELDFYVESYQVGQAAQPQVDLPPGEWRLAEKLLGISAFAQPDDRFLVSLGNQIHETARKPDETIELVIVQGDHGVYASAQPNPA